MIRMGCIGFGNRISSVINHFLREVEPELRIVGIVDPDERKARTRLTECDREGVVFHPDVKTMMKKGKIDALAIGTRCNLHAQYAIEALQYPVPLYLEKPVAISMDQAVALEKSAEKTTTQVVVSFPLRVSPLCVKSKEILSSGVIGSPEHILSTNYVPYGTVYWELEYRNYAITGGLFLQKATHDLDYMMFLADSPIVRVAAMATQGRVFGGKKKKGLTCSKCDETGKCPESPENRKRNHSGGSAKDHNCLFSVDCGNAKSGTNEDSSSCLVEFASGTHGVYTQVFFSRRDAARRGAVISGYRGTLDFDWYRNDIRLVHHHQPFSETIAAGSGMSHFGGDIELAYDFIGLIRGTAQSRTSLETGLRSVYTCLAARESAATGRSVKVRQLGQIE